MAFVSDTFTGTGGTNLTAHTGETGATWTVHANSTAGAISIDTNRAAADGGNRIYYASGTPATAEYDVEADVVVIAKAGHQGHMITGRHATGADTFYAARISPAGGNIVQLFKRVAGTFTTLQSAAFTPSDGSTYRLKLEIRDAAKKVYIDGVLYLTDTDNSITAAGKAGIRSGSADPSGSGMPLDNFAATDVSSGQTVAPGFVASSATVYAPTVVGAQVVTPGFVASSSQVYAPSMSGGGSSTVTPGFVASTAMAYRPAMSGGAVTRTRKWVPSVPVIGNRKSLRAISRFLASAVDVPSTLKTDAIWTWFNDQRAVIQTYNGTRTLLVGWVNSVGDVGVTGMNLATGATSSFTLNNVYDPDDHSNVSVTVLPDDRIMCSYFGRSGGDGKFHWRISTNPGDISAFGSEQMGLSLTSYTNPFILPSESNKGFLFYRGSTWNPTFVTSTDSFATISTATVLFSAEADLPANSNRPYVKYVSDGAGRIHIFPSAGHPREITDGRGHQYHFYYEAGNFYKSDGTLIRSLAAVIAGSPIMESETTKIYDATASGKNSWPYGAELDATGKPVLTYGVGGSTDIRYRYSRWSGSAWVSYEIKTGEPTIYGAEINYGGLCVPDPRDTNTLWVSLNEDASTWKIEKWVTADGGANWTKTVIESGGSVKRARPYVPRNAQTGDPVLWWQGTYTTFTNFLTDIRMYPGR